MQIDFSSRDDTYDTALVILVADETAIDGRTEHLPDAARALLRGAIRAQRFTGKTGQLVEAFVDTGTGPRRVLVVGLGDKGYEQAGGKIAARLMTSGETGVTVLAEDATADDAANLALGIQLRSWRYDRYRTELKAEERPSLQRVMIVAADGADTSWRSRAAVADGVLFARTLVTEPGNVIYPETFVEECRSLEALGIELTVLDQMALESLGMGALLGVARGSVRAPRVLAMRWNGTDDATSRPLALVGKGVTFDSGGISIKPAAGMADMKWDMGGAAAVAGAMKAIAGRKAKAHVIGVCGLVENMPDGDAQRPGDIVTSMSGRTIEVLDTDAEGRLVLCDVLTWVQKTHAPHTIVDIATLTGSIMMALGDQYAGLFANDDMLANQLLAAGGSTGEALWRMPLGPAYSKLIESDVADIRNLGPRPAGAITAAAFLQRFIEGDVRWAHLDVAGVVWAEKEGTLHGKGATGYGVRLLDRLIADHHESRG
jgi:leucyl aminopeptidase